MWYCLTLSRHIYNIKSRWWQTSKWGNLLWWDLYCNILSLCFRLLQSCVSVCVDLTSDPSLGRAWVGSVSHAWLWTTRSCVIYRSEYYTDSWAKTHESHGPWCSAYLTSVRVSRLWLCCMDILYFVWSLNDRLSLRKNEYNILCESIICDICGTIQFCLNMWHSWVHTVWITSSVCLHNPHVEGSHNYIDLIL